MIQYLADHLCPRVGPVLQFYCKNMTSLVKYIFWGLDKRVSKEYYSLENLMEIYLHCHTWLISDLLTNQS